MRVIRVLPMLCFFIVITVGAQESPDQLQPPGFIGEEAGSGSWPAVAQSRGDLRTHTLYRPVTLPSSPLPVFLWGNGGCSDNGLGHSYFLREIASHGYIVVALGYAIEERPLAGARVVQTAPQAVQGAAPPPAAPGPDATSMEQHFQALQWLTARNDDALDELHGHIDLDRVAVGGHSCGGLQAIKTAADPRIDTVLVFNSGVYNTPGGRSGINVGKDELAAINGPALYITGGPSDIAHANSVDDVSRITHVPVFFGWLPVGHGGTFAKNDTGGEWAEVAVHWLQWQMENDSGAGRWFTGSDCTLCTMEAWTVERFVNP